MTLRGDEIVSQMSQAKYLYLRDISEPRDNSLRLVVEEALANVSASGLIRDGEEMLPGMLKDARMIASGHGVQGF